MLGWNLCFLNGHPWLYHDTFSPTPGSTATRTIISIVTAEDLEIHSVDFTQAFIQADRLPEGVNGWFFISSPSGSPRSSTSGIVYEIVSPPVRATCTQHLIVTSKVRGLWTQGSKNLYGDALPLLNTLHFCIDYYNLVYYKLVYYNHHTRLPS